MSRAREKLRSSQPWEPGPGLKELSNDVVPEGACKWASWEAVDRLVQSECSLE